MFNVNVLFANDDVLTQWIMSEVLAEAGCEVTSICRAEEAIDLLSDDPDFDVLIADLTLSDAAAASCLEDRWRAALPRCPIIYTGPDRSALRRPLRPGEWFLASPIDASTLLKTIGEALDAARFQLPTPVRACDRYVLN